MSQQNTTVDSVVLVRDVQQELWGTLKKFLESCQAVLDTGNLLIDFLNQVRGKKPDPQFPNFPYFEKVYLGPNSIKAVQKQTEVYRAVSFLYDTNLYVSLAISQSGALSFVQEKRNHFDNHSITWYKIIMQSKKAKQLHGSLAGVANNFIPIPATLAYLMSDMTIGNTCRIGDPGSAEKVRFSHEEIKAFFEAIFGGTLSEL